MRRVPIILLLVATAIAAGGCLGGSGGSGPVHVLAPATRMEITYFGMLRRACPTNDPCGLPSLQRIQCPQGSRCVPPAAHAELVRCPGGDRAGLHCYAVRPSGIRGPRVDPSVILQQRELSCSPDRDGYADPAAACRVLADYVRRSRRSREVVCSCPPQLWPSRAAGTFRDRHVTLDLSPCALCGLGRAAAADVTALTPALAA